MCTYYSAIHFQQHYLTHLRSCADTWAKGNNLSDDGGEVCKRRLDDYWFKMAEPIAIKRQNNQTS